MTGMIRHRGPDDEGYALFDLKSNMYKIFYGDDTPRNVIDSPLKYAPKVQYHYTSENFTVALAHRRLSVIDLTSSGHQPMCDETGRYWIAYNGEIYNFRDIREELQHLGYSFFSNCDTEVVLKAYIAWGSECQNRFNGMWAIAIWDNVEKMLWISRDRFGVKPLYYMFHDDFFIVCSEIKSLIPIIDLTPNYKEVYAYLIDGPSEAHPETFFKNAFRFPAGHSAVYSAKSSLKSLSFDKYWELGGALVDNSFSEKKLKEYAQKYYFLLEDAVNIRLYADVTVGCALSGGLDSSSIAYCAKNIHKNYGREDSLIFLSNVYKNTNEKYCDETEYIDSVVRHLNVESIRDCPQKSEILEMNDRGLWVEENCYDKFNISTFNTYLLCKRKGVKVILDGQGADEQLAGYKRFWYSYFYSKSQFRIEYFLSLFKKVLPYKTALYYGFFSRNYLKKHYKEYFFTIKGLDTEYRISRNVLFPENYLTDINTATSWSVKNSLKKLLRQIDSNSMSLSIESRQPFMDYRLVEFLNSLPDPYKMHSGWTKYIARIAFKGKLPDKIVWRKDKMGWPMPLKEWLKDDLYAKMDESIKKSRLLMELKNRFDYDQPGNDKTKMLQGSELRRFIRLYNISRVETIFLQ